MNEVTRKVIAHAIQQANAEIAHEDAEARAHETAAREHRDRMREIIVHRQALAESLDGGILSAKPEGTQ